MPDNIETNPGEDLQKFEENPYDPELKGPEDIVRLFYTHNVPIIPVISKRGILIGILKKEDVIAELSDIERARNRKIDKFITDLARRMTFDDLLLYGKIPEFLVINIFGDEQGRWTRLQLFTACEKASHAPGKEEDVTTEIHDQKEEQMMEWILYLVLENIPRALYAVNADGKTIFYNSHFEEIYVAVFGTDDVDTSKAESVLRDADSSEIAGQKEDGELVFHNRTLDVSYEKIPLVSREKRLGFLYFLERKGDRQARTIHLPDGPLQEQMDACERQVIVHALQREGDIAAAAKKLKISKSMLQSRAKKQGIDTKK